MADGRRGRVCPRGEKSASFKHGHATEHGGKSREYLSWRSMMQRCTDTNSAAYPRYGGRGIKVCDRWRKFANFLADMGARPEGKSLDRWPDNDGNYEPGNCRWATPEEQAANTRTNHTITAAGRTQTITAWARELGVDPGAIRYRIDKMGWDPERAVTTPRSTTRGPKSRKDITLA
jgi:hypothetical protein